ncbi:TVP38/TMEM64 family membrane protein [Balamuthia mandrillaris]
MNAARESSYQRLGSEGSINLSDRDPYVPSIGLESHDDAAAPALLVDEEQVPLLGSSPRKSRCKSFWSAVWKFLKGITLGTWIRLGIFLLVVLTITLLIVFLNGYIKKGLKVFLEKMEKSMPWGPFALGGVYVVCTVLFVPGSILTLGAGFAFGLRWGVVTVSIASTIGATCAFFLGRTLLRGWVERKVEQYKVFRAVDRAIETQGWTLVLLIRLSPVIPFNIINYAFALTKVKWWHYILCSWIGMLPGTVLYVYIGSVAANLSEIFTGQANQKLLPRIFFYCGFGVALLVVIVVTFIARRAVMKALRENNELEAAKQKEEEAEEEERPAEEGIIASSERQNNQVVNAEQQDQETEELLLSS